MIADGAVTYIVPRKILSMNPNPGYRKESSSYGPKSSNNGTFIDNELKEIKDPTVRFENEYYDLPSKILDVVRNEIDKIYLKMDRYNSLL